MPDGPTIPTSVDSASRATRSDTTRSRPQKYSASERSNEASPLYGQTARSSVALAGSRDRPGQPARAPDPDAVLCRSSSCSPRLGSRPSSPRKKLTHLPIDLKRVRLTARPIQRQHQLRAQPLLQRVQTRPAPRALRSARRRRPAPDRHRFAPSTPASATPPSAGSRAERTRAAPDRPAAARATAPAPLAAARPPTRHRPPASSPRPSASRRSKQATSSCSGPAFSTITTRPRHQHPARVAVLQQPSQPRHRDPRRVQRAVGHLLAEQLVDQLLGPDQLVRVHQQQGQQRPLALPPSRNSVPPRHASSGPSIRNCSDPRGSSPMAGDYPRRAGRHATA